MKKILDKIANCKEQMRSILDLARQEGRQNLTPEEDKRFKALEDEVKMLEYELKARSVISTEAPESGAKRFAEHASKCLATGGNVSASLRSIIAEPSVHDASVPVVYQELQKPLEEGLILSRLGGRVLYGVEGEPLWPFVSGVEASVLGENVEVGESTLAFETVRSTPKRLSVCIPVSRRAIHQSNLNLYALVMESLASGVARKLNRILCDTSAHGDYNGPFVDATMAPDTTLTRTAAAFTYDDALALEHAVLNKLTDHSYDPVYIMNYKTAQKLRSTPIVKGQSEMLLTMHREGGVHYAMMNGRRVELSNYVGEDQVLFGDFKYLGLPQYGDFDIVIDPYTGARKNSVIFTLNADMDMVKIRKEAFAISKKNG